ncbi:unnamed protein product [Zymoseptoria tritici ST99CH_1E4]|uniref:Uncharacterized protein n=1 Tax=Zymoseptoria tritici ST99CH_1E4 TaxID=1276532 RepID=A0A2H1GQ64_ZYMTR|nr:unnamed protein product [Zymoseptoria tritici ST99CH_1E4]
MSTPELKERAVAKAIGAAAAEGGGSVTVYGTCSVASAVQTQGPGDTTSHKSQSSTVAGPSPCPLLELPAELRSAIEELVFTTDTLHDENEEVDLLAANPPSISLLLVNSTLLHETKGFFAAAQESYWSNTAFIINGNDDAAKAALASIPDAAIERVTKLRMRFPVSNRFPYVDPSAIPSKSDTPLTGAIELIADGHWKVCSENSHRPEVWLRYGRYDREIKVLSYFGSMEGMEGFKRGGSKFRTESLVPLRKQIEWMWEMLEDEIQWPRWPTWTG